MATRKQYEEFIIDGLRLGIFRKFFPDHDVGRVNTSIVWTNSSDYIIISYRCTNLLLNDTDTVQAVPFLYYGRNESSQISINDLLPTLDQKTLDYILFNLNLFI